jgi:2,3-bisphosphoglycerate-independent phosphoglycerate mutase
MENKYPMFEAMRKAYAQGLEDETLLPLVLTNNHGNVMGCVRSGDSVIFYNIRGEREIELTRSLTEDDFNEFPVEKSMRLNFATMIEYQKDLNVDVAFPPDEIIKDTLSEIIANNKIRQVKITEAEKATHVGFFFNGKNNKPFLGEERITIPTRKDVALFDEAPEMSIDEITRAAVEKINDEKYGFITVNFPNVDVVGHIENESAVIKAVETVDKNIGIVINEALKMAIPVIVTADHGTVEKWRYPDGAVDTGHTDSPVPFILIHPDKNIRLKKKGSLIDIAPTVLDILGLAPSKLMTGLTLIEKQKIPFNDQKRLLLIIADGWGYGENNDTNLIAIANTPVMDSLMETYTASILEASGESVGLPPGTVGNSEAGHLHIGAGRVIYSDRLKIDRAINDKSFYENKAFLKVMREAKKSGNALHLMGIVSFFSSHGSINHLFTLMDMAKQEGVSELFIHAMLGRRGEMPESGAQYIKKIEEKAFNINLGKVVSVIGRYWSMDREDNWDRIEKTYRMLVYGEGEKIPEV